MDGREFSAHKDSINFNLNTNAAINTRSSNTETSFLLVKHNSKNTSECMSKKSGKTFASRNIKLLNVTNAAIILKY